jgi:hypothetical protein
VFKTADEGLTNNDTLQNDNDLVVALEASSDYYVECFVILSADSATPGWQFQFIEPTSAVFDGHWMSQAGSPTIAAFTQVNGGLGFALPLNGRRIVKFEIVVRTVGNAGNFQLQWAQNIATAATTTTVESGSWIKATKLG